MYPGPLFCDGKGGGGCTLHTMHVGDQLRKYDEGVTTTTATRTTLYLATWTMNIDCGSACWIERFTLRERDVAFPDPLCTT